MYPGVRQATTSIFHSNILCKAMSSPPGTIVDVRPPHDRYCIKGSQGQQNNPDLCIYSSIEEIPSEYVSEDDIPRDAWGWGTRGSGESDL